MEKPLSEWTGKELQAEIDLYEAAEVEDIPKFKNKADAAAWIETQRAEGGIGIPHIVTKEEVKKLVDEGMMYGDRPVEVGDVIILGPIKAPTDEERAAAEAEAKKLEEEEKAKAEAAAKAKEDAKANKGKNTGNTTVQAPKEPTLYFQKRPVIAVNNKLQGGKLYKEVVLNGETMLFTQEQFDEQVKPLE